MLLNGFVTTGPRPTSRRERLDRRRKEIEVVGVPGERSDVVPAAFVELGVQRRGVCNVHLGRVLLELRGVDVEATVRHDAAFVERVLVGMTQRDELVVLREIGEVEACGPSDEVDTDVAGVPQRPAQLLQFLTSRCAVESAESDVDRVDRATTEQFDDVVARAFQREDALDDSRVIGRNCDPAVVTEKIGSVQQTDVQHVALDPFAAVEQAAQLAQLAPTRHAARPARSHGTALI